MTLATAGPVIDYFHRAPDGLLFEVTDEPPETSLKVTNRVVVGPPFWRCHFFVQVFSFGILNLC